MSDFHLDKSEDKIAISKKTIDSLCSILKDIDSKKKIDLIIFSGDMINTGGKSFDSTYNAFKAFKILFIEKVLHTLKLPQERFILSPGNHDVDRSLDNKYIESGLSLELINSDEVGKFYKSEKEDGIKRIEPYKRFEKDLYKNSFQESDFYQKKFESAYKIQIDDTKIGVASLNTAWRCWDSGTDKGKILLSEHQIKESSEFLSDCNIKIAVAHHHYNQLAEFEQNQVEKLLNQNFQIYFCGHTHNCKMQLCMMPTGNMFTFITPGILAENYNTTTTEYKNGISVIDYNQNIGKVEVSHFIQNHTSRFFKDITLGENGTWKTEIPLGEVAKEKQIKQEILINIKDEISSLDGHLLSYKTETKAPKSIPEIFVMPNIVMKSEITDCNDAEEITISNISELINSKNNFILYGIKEVGKTVLLDKIVYELTYNASHITPIPVLLDFKDIQNDIEKNIFQYWSKPRRDVVNVIENNPILLLIDNISFEQTINCTTKIRAISKFIHTHPKSRFIATSLALYENDINIDSEDQNLLEFETITIKQFKAKQIRKLIDKWFVNYVGLDKPKKLDRIVNAFESLNLPRTPFAISMFLSILERQESFKPQNNATLIETYIEEILDKQNPLSNLRSTFDYENKISLLAEISYQMLKANNTNYSLSFVDTINAVEMHLDKRLFGDLYNPKTIIREFKKCGVFVEEDNIIRFRFNCFFEYFLAKKMTYDTKFCEEVLLEENYLKYANEIDYYTGLNRDRQDILEKIIDRLENDYIAINELVSDQLNNIDNFFNVDKSIVSQLDANKLLEILPSKQTQEDIEARSDIKLDRRVNSEEIIHKDASNKYLSYGRSLILAMTVLKNSEEIDQANLKSKSYDIILRNSISYAVLFKSIAEKMLKYNLKSSSERVFDLKVVLRFLPLLHQLMLSNNVGSYKLSQVVLNKIKKDKEQEKISEFEEFLSVFLYCDIKGNDYKSIMKEFIKKANRAYISDSCLMKLLSYYFESNNEQDDLSIVNLLADLHIKINSNENNKNNRLNKSAVIESFKKRKKDYCVDIKS